MTYSGILVIFAPTIFKTFSAEFGPRIIACIYVSIFVSNLLCLILRSSSSKDSNINLLICACLSLIALIINHFWFDEKIDKDKL